MRSEEEVKLKKDRLKKALFPALESKDIISAGAILSSIGALVWVLSDVDGEEIHEALAREYGSQIYELNKLFDRGQNTAIEKRDEPFVPE